MYSHARSSNLAHINASSQCSNAKQLNTLAREATTQQQNSQQKEVILESIFEIHINKHKCIYDRTDDYIQQDHGTNRKTSSNKVRQLKSKRGWNHVEERKKSTNAKSTKSTHKFQHRGMSEWQVMALHLYSTIHPNKTKRFTNINELSHSVFKCVHIQFEAWWNSNSKEHQ